MEFVCPKAHACAKFAKKRFLKVTGLLLLAILTLITFSGICPTSSHAAQASLTWDAPTTYTDGTPITSQLGYRIYTGTTSGSYSQNIDAGNATSYTLSSLNDGTTYYIAVTADDAYGDVSGFSNQATYTTPAAPPPTNLYTLTASAGNGGSISPSGSVAISQGLSQSFTITPATGYKIAAVTVDGASVGAVSSYTFSNVTANHTITASFTASTTSYTISASAGSGGTISPVGTATVNSGGSQTYTIAPATGYQIASVTVDGASVGAVTSYTFSNVSANHTISATFASSAPSGWSNRSFTSQSGTFTASFDVIPNANNIDAVTALSAVPMQSYTDGAALVLFNTSGTITVRNGAAYSADVSVPYTAGNTYHIRMLVNVPNHVYDVYVTPPNGIEVHLTSGYAFRTEQATVSMLNNLGACASIGSQQVLNFTVTAQTAPTPVTYVLSASSGTGGSIFPSGSISINSGGNQTCSISANAGYTIADVTVDGISVGAIAGYTFNNVSANHSISATFQLVPQPIVTTYSIVATAGTGGSISPSGTTSVAGGTNKTYQVLPNKRFKILDVKADGVSVGAVSSYTFSNIAANHAIQAIFQHL